MIALKEGRSEASQMIIGSKRFSKKRSQEDEADVKRIIHRCSMIMVRCFVDSGCCCRIC